MRLPLKTALTALIAGVLIASVAATAFGNHLSLNATSFRAVWNPLKFTSPELEVPVECRVTLEGTFHSQTISKVVGSLIGNVTRAIVARPCAGGEAWVHNGVENPLNRGVPPTSLPWHVSYEGFTGRLPEIGTILLLLTGIRFTLSAGGGLCLGVYGSATENIIGVATVGAGGTITALEAERNAVVRKTEGGVFCPANGTFLNRSTVTQLGTTATLVVRLI